MDRPISILDLKPGEFRPMTPDETEMWIKIGLVGKLDQGPVAFDSPIFEGANVLELAARTAILPRLSRAGVSLTQGAFVAFAVLSDRVGDLVLWAHFALELARRQRKTLVDFEAVSFGLPHGVPTEEGRRRVWDAQKYFGGAEGNWLDTAAAWTLDPVPA